MFRCRMTAQELIAEQLGHLCSRCVMEGSEEQRSERKSVGIDPWEHPGSGEDPAPVRQWVLTSGRSLEQAAGAVASWSLGGSLQSACQPVFCSC